MHIRHALFTMFFCASSLVSGAAQIVSAPEPQLGSVTGTVTDIEGGVIPGATVTIDGPEPRDHHVATTSDSGYFTVNGLRSAVTLRVNVSASGFANWNSSSVVLQPGQQL